MRRTKLLAAAALLLAALLCLTGCEDTDSASPEPAATAAVPELTAAPVTAAPAAPTAPEATATPGIYGGTVLFYNPNGGSFYHVDQNCARVADKYLPLMGHFTYDQLGEGRYQVLKPCDGCGAPPRPD